jgi:hypothetical protein
VRSEIRPLLPPTGSDVCLCRPGFGAAAMGVAAIPEGQLSLIRTGSRFSEILAERIAPGFA